MNKEIKPFKTLTDENIKTLVGAGIIPRNTPVDQIGVFSHICNERGLSPFAKEIYLVGYGGKYSVIVGINGFRKLSAQTGQYAGCDDALFDLQPDGSYKTAAQYAAGAVPKTCTVTVYRIIGGIRCPFTHTIVVSEFNTRQQNWKKMPFQMAAKVAESFAHRKGFSDCNSGLFIEGELGALQDINGATIKPKHARRARPEPGKLVKGSDNWNNCVKAIESGYDVDTLVKGLKQKYNITVPDDLHTELTKIFDDAMLNQETHEHAEVV